MFPTRWPTGVDEVVMNRLVNVVNDSLFEALRIIAEQLNARRRFFCDQFVPSFSFRRRTSSHAKQFGTPLRITR